MAFNFGFESAKKKYTDKQSIDDKLRGLQEQNYAGAQGLPQSYGLLSRGTIDRYMDPFEDEVVSTSMSDLDRFRQRALADNKANAIQSGAFSSYDGRAVADALTNESFFNQAGLLSSRLRSQGYGQALGVAQDENRASQAFPFMRQGILNSTLAGITPEVTRTGSSKGSGWNFGFSTEGANSTGGEGGSFDAMKYVASLFGG